MTCIELSFKVVFEMIERGITSRTVSPMAQATGFPPKVEKYPPSRSDTSLVERLKDAFERYAVIP